MSDAVTTPATPAPAAPAATAPVAAPAAAPASAPVAPAATPAATTPSAATPLPTTQAGTTVRTLLGTESAEAPKATTPEASKAEAAPDAYEIRLPEGVTADAALLDGFKALAQTEGLKGEAAQKIADLYVQAQVKADEAFNKARDAQHNQWFDSLPQDKEFGGAQWDANKAVALRAIEKFATPELRSILKDSGLGAHPEMVRFAYRVGKAMAEDSVAGSAGGPGPATTEEARLRAAYPSMYQEGK